jgi:hypothetical protein
LTYNVIPFYDVVSEVVTIPEVDNLRLVNEQYDAKKAVDEVNKLSDKYNTLLFVSSYYGDASYEVWEREGYLDDSLSIIYSGNLDIDTFERLNFEQGIVYIDKYGYVNQEVKNSLRETNVESVYIFDR